MGKTEFIAVQCYQCKTFQVGRQTKTNKWTCKICNSKQSVRKIYAVSNQAKDIRQIIQKLNIERPKIEENLKQSEPSEQEKPVEKPRQQSKWEKYMQPKKEESDDEPDETVTTVLEEPKVQRRKKRKSEQLDDSEDVNTVVEKPKKKSKRKEDDQSSQPRQQKKSQPMVQKSSTSKWAKYMQPRKVDESDDEEDQTIALDLDQLNS
jgi:hypothetical protein